MVDLTTTYLGLGLKNPLVASPSPLSWELDTVRQLEDAGVSALVMHSLFEEEITHETHELELMLTTYGQEVDGDWRNADCYRYALTLAEAAGGRRE